MSEPIDIKTKKIISQPLKQGFSRNLVSEVLQTNILSHWDTWGKFQATWTNRAYRTFKDLDKYIVLIYLIRDSWQQSADKFEYFSYDEFYSKENVVIDKINLMKISTELNIPKETVRRKVIELQKEGVLDKNEADKIIGVLNKANEASKKIIGEQVKQAQMGVELIAVLLFYRGINMILSYQSFKQFYNENIGAMIKLNNEIKNNIKTEKQEKILPSNDYYYHKPQIEVIENSVNVPYFFNEIWIKQ